MPSADGAENIFAPLEGRLLINDWPVPERVVFIALLAYSSLMASIHGVVVLSEPMLAPLVAALNPEVVGELTATLDALEQRGAIKRYAGNLIWIVDRWSYWPNRGNYGIQKSACNKLHRYPLVWQDFAEHYGLDVDMKPSIRTAPIAKQSKKQKGAGATSARDAAEAAKLRHKGGAK